MREIVQLRRACVCAWCVPIVRCGAPTPPQKFCPEGRAAAAVGTPDRACNITLYIGPRVVPTPSPSSSPHPALKPRGHVDGSVGEDRKSACERESEGASDRTRERERVRELGREGEGSEREAGEEKWVSVSARV